MLFEMLKYINKILETEKMNNIILRIFLLFSLIRVNKILLENNELVDNIKKAHQKFDISNDKYENEIDINNRIGIRKSIYPFFTRIIEDKIVIICIDNAIIINIKEIEILPLL